MSRPRRLRAALAATLLLLVSGFCALNVLAFNHARAMMRFVEGGSRTAPPERLSRSARLLTLFRGVRLPRPHGPATPADCGLTFETRTIHEAGVMRLGAWYCPAASNAPLAIVCHGYSADKSAVLPEAAALHGLGLALLLIDFRGSGASSEAYTTAGFVEAEDVAAAVAYARASLPEHAALILYGQSMGAAAILRAVAECGAQADALIIEAVFDSLLNTARNRFRLMHTPSFPSAELLVFWGGAQMGFNAFEFRPVDYARAVTQPALFLHGQSDPRARLADARRVFDAVPGPKTFHVFENAAHESYAASHPEAWREVVSQFLAERGIVSLPPSATCLPAGAGPGPSN